MSTAERRDGPPAAANSKILKAQHDALPATDADSPRRDRADWVLFRSLETLGQKAGVPQHRLVETVAKELADNALDELERQGLDPADHCRVGLVTPNGFYVENDGRGLWGTDAQIASLFSINRPYRSSKLVRTISRGALGNGLRVVAGSVLCSGGGYIIVETGGRILRLEPQHDDGCTTVTRLGASTKDGTRVAVHLGPALLVTTDSLRLARQALQAAAVGGEVYKGKTSAYWYSRDMFYELLQSAPTGQTVRQFVEGFDGCTGAKAGAISRPWHDRSARSLGRDEAAALLADMRAATVPVKPGRLGRIGPCGDLGAAYARVEGTKEAGIPFAVEAWLRTTDKKPTAGHVLKVDCRLMVNKTPVVSEFSGHSQGPGHVALFGGGLAWGVKFGGRQSPASVVINIQTPAIALTSDGKAPDLTAYVGPFEQVLVKCGKAAQQATPRRRRRSEKDITYQWALEVMRIRSSEGKHTVNMRQLYYGIRPIISAEVGKEPRYDNFQRNIAHYENAFGPIPNLTRDPRGSLYIPHEGRTIPLGTTSVREFRRPAWTFNKVVYLEKEGLFAQLIAERWPEKHDCALMTSKGYTTRAVKDLIDLLGADGEPITVYCVHDADAAGTMILQTLVEQTRAREARRVKVHDLGLNPWEAVATPLSLKGEDINANEDSPPRTRPVADYVKTYDREHGTHWEQTLQTRRYELDEMATTAAFLAWLNGKMAGTSKVMPPAEVLEEQHLANEIRRVTEEIEQAAFKAYGRDEKVEKAVTALREDEERRERNKTLLPQRVEHAYTRDGTQSWRGVLEKLPYKLRKSGRTKGTTSANRPR